MKPRLILELTALVGLLLAIGAYVDSQRGPPAKSYVFSGKPVVDFEGRVTHAQTGEGLADTYVLVNMRSYKAVPHSHHGVSGCRESSQVVKTNVHGIYRVYWEWPGGAAGTPDDLTIWLKVYKPEHEYFPLIRPRISWYSAQERTDFQLVEDTSSLEHRLDFLRRLIGDNCRGTRKGDIALDFVRDIYHEARELICELPTESVMTYDDYWQAEALLLGYVIGLFERRYPSASEDERREWGDARMAAVKKFVGEVSRPRFTSNGETPATVMAQQFARMCEFYSPERLNELTTLGTSQP